ncbi:MAG: M1 family metallopeptidase [Candidatus Heimdallarchaeota archaeon]|nr:M1 family metallopeptidase [Candidatus Heimdallarchaeota archaeon]
MKYKPIHYDLELDIDLKTTSFLGKTTVNIDILEPSNTIILNALDLEIQSVSFNDLSLQTSYDMQKQELSITLPEPLTGEISLVILYRGEINDKLAGFYQSRYKVGEEMRLAAVTQFQENDARRAFPCFDHPGMKATFDVHLIAEKGLTVISNNIVKEETEMGEKVKFSFERTPKMSTYLLFFAVGEFEFVESMQDDVLVRVGASPGQAKQYGEFALDFAKKSLQYCQDYFQVPYPFKKLDNIGTPDFAHGAMENWGAILYRENLLLVYPGLTSKRQETVIQMVVAHEITHQWFGNSTSPTSWKYIWLNESFATTFGYSVIDAYYPEKKIWEFFLLNETVGALGADAYLETAAIEVPGDGAQGMTIKTAPIIYNKGGSILRMLEAYITPEKYKEGLRYYLNKYKFDNASSDDLWKALAESSGLSVDSMMESWVLQPGYPKVIANREGNILTLRQERFTYLKNDDMAIWEIPVSIIQYKGDDEISQTNHLMDMREMEVELYDNCTSFKINKDVMSFIRVQYEEENLEMLEDLIRNKTLSTIDRWNIINELYAIMTSGHADLEFYLNYLDNYMQENNYQSISSISGQLFRLYSLFDGELKEKIASKGKSFLESILDQIKYEPQENEDRDISSIRGGLILNAVRFGSETAEKFALGLYADIKEGKSVTPDLLPNILRIGAMKLNDVDYLKSKFENASNEQESVIYLGTLGHFTDLSIIEEMQMYAFDKVPSRNRTTIINPILANPEARKTIWTWYLANLDNFEALHEYMYQMALTTLIPRCVDNKDEVREFFLDYIKKKPHFKDAVDIGLERIEIDAQLKNRYE